jgi:hypothetical protein
MGYPLLGLLRASIPSADTMVNVRAPAPSS